jgi:hypothetical protein
MPSTIRRNIEMIPIIYYAHSMSDYNTEKERHELELLRNHFPYGMVFNPNCRHIQSLRDPMKGCFEILHDLYIRGVAFSTQDEIYLSSGVFDEARLAQKRLLQLFRIFDDRIEQYNGVFWLVKESRARHWARVI